MSNLISKINKMNVVSEFCIYKNNVAFAVVIKKIRKLLLVVSKISKIHHRNLKISKMSASAPIINLKKLYMFYFRKCIKYNL